MQTLPAALAPMAAYRQFIIYMLVPSRTRPGKVDKYPCCFRTGEVKNAHDPAIWTDAQTAIAAAAHWNTRGGYPFGAGFVLTANDPYWFLDIDGAHDGNDWSPVAKQLVAAFPGAAVEVSSSGRGLHIFGTGAVPPHGTKNGTHGLEFYHTGRFVALTGTNATGNAALDFSAVLPWLVASYFPPDAADLHGAADWTSNPCAEWRGPEDDDRLIERALRSQSAAGAFGTGASFADLWYGNTAVLSRAYPDNGGSAPYDQSSADSALAQHLAFWTGKNCERIERLMRRSSLAREKWEREDYLPRTITKVCARQVDVLTDKELELPPDMAAPSAVHAGPTAAAGVAAAPVPVTGSTYASAEQQVELFAGCVYVTDRHAILVRGGALLKEGQFNVVFGGYTFMQDNKNEKSTSKAWDAFTQNQVYRCPRADTTCFKPQRAPGEIIDVGGRTAVNTWWPVEVERRPGDATPFLRHLDLLLPNARDRAILLAYMAACVQHIGVKFQWAPVIQGCEGNGKTLLSRCVAKAIGPRYVHWPKASKLAAQFNGWLVGKLFFAVEDIFVPDNKREVMEELKPMITGGDGLEIERKGVDQDSADICGNFMFNCNHQGSIIKHKNDRRYAMFFTAQQEAAHLARDGMNGNYMRDLYAWLDGGGYAIVAELLHTYPIPDELNPATSCQRAPETSSTAEAIEQSRGGVEQEVMEAIEQGLPGFAGGWVSSIYLARLLEQMGKGGRLSHHKRRELLATLGYVPHPGLRDGRVDNTVLPDAGKPRLFVRAGSPAAFITGAAEIAKAYSAAQVPQPVFNT